MPDRNFRAAALVETAEHFRSSLCAEFMPLIEKLGTLAQMKSKAGFRLEGGQVQNAKRLLEDLEDVIAFGRIEHRPPPPPPSAMDVLRFARAMMREGNQADRERGTVYIESVAECAAGDERFQHHLAAMMPKKPRRQRKAA